MVVIIMGVSGIGKTTVGRALSERLGWAYYDGDDLHPDENVSKMSAGDALTDVDRAPWLEALHELISKLLERDQSAVLACSALKKSYRELLLDGNDGVQIVFLKGSRELCRRRLIDREGHFMEAEMLDSQFAALEEPDADEQVLVVAAAKKPNAIVDEIIEMLPLSTTSQ